MAGIFDTAPMAEGNGIFDMAPMAKAPPAVEHSPEEVARRLGILGAERLTGEVLPFTQATLEADARELEKPLLTLPEGVKKKLGEVALGAPLAAISAFLPLLVTSTKTGQQAAKGAGETIGGLIEGATSPVGAMTLASAVMRPAEVVPLLMAQGAKQGSEELAAGAAEGNTAKIAQGAATLAAAAAPLALSALHGVARSTPPALPRGPAFTFNEGLLPDLQPHAVSKAIFSKPFGIGNLPVMGRLLDPNARVPSNLSESLAAYSAERHGVAPAIAGNVGLKMKARGIDKAFPVDAKTGELTSVQATRPGQSLHPSDVFEALQKDPESYALTESQRAAFSELEAWRKESNVLEQKYSLAPEEIAEPGDSAYFPRIVIERPPEDIAPPIGGSRVGAKQFFQKARLFETEQEGVTRGWRYEPSIESRVVTRTERLYRAIADKRLASDETLGARTRKQVENELRESYAEELGAGELTEAKLQAIVNSVEHKGTVWGQPGFAGKIFDPETASVLNKAFPQADSSFRHRFVRVNNALKAFRLSADLGVALLQGLPTLFRNPVVWSKAAGNSLLALGDGNVLARYAQQNAQAASEFTQLGGSVGRLPEMLAGLEKGSLVERIPVLRVPFQAVARQFETFLDVAKLELWKAWRDVTPIDQRLAVARTIESQLAMGRMESIGVSRNRALAERALLLAPSYYRGAVNLVGAIGERGVSGKIARQALSAYAAGGLLTFYGLAHALGMDFDDIQERLNPASSNFLMWKVDINGRDLNIGFGGIHRSLLRLLANMTKTSIEHPENWLSLTPRKNPLVRWYRGHAASVPGITWDAITGRDFLGQESDLTTVGQSVVPLAAQPLIRGKEETQAVEIGASLIGLSAYSK